MQILVVQTNTEIPQLLQRFNGVYIGDCTTVALPDSLATKYPGCGGGKDPEKKSAAMMIFHLKNQKS